ncbi:MAG TPA: OsmC family peroxiredoxin [Acholeplasma sp.]|nr:OsmC family peroxiredoxin [Acholeplasma sp.]
MQKDYLFKTTAVNKDGGNGKAYIKDGMVVPIASIHGKERLGTNPEELLALSYSTCLNSTLQSILRARKLNNETEVRVDVYFKRNQTDRRFFFQVDAFIEVKGMTIEEMTPFVEEAHYRCPVSQLMHESETVTVNPWIFED